MTAKETAAPVSAAPVSAAPASAAPASAGHRAAPVHVHPREVSLEAALLALADPVRRTLVRELAASGPWQRTCGTFDVPVTKATLSRHFAVLREAGLLEQKDAGARRFNRLREEEFGERFPGLLDLVLRDEG
ncbi:helix-turn-helix domain-containing protein [Streptomyces sp. Q6]|uniref:Helix-turn-helix domain-containing protein n=1 Tax=Streptomyces citrinus TaxID=3118173 RepID=A0ACD5AER7_9ACTN